MLVQIVKDVSGFVVLLEFVERLELQRVIVIAQNKRALRVNKQIKLGQFTLGKIDGCLLCVNFEYTLFGTVFALQ